MNEFKDVIDSLITDARDADVEYFMIPGIDIATSKKSIEISNNFMKVFAAVGIHPTEDLENASVDEMIIKLEGLSLDDKVKAIGEIGLDYYHFKSPPKIQKKYFETQLKLAVKIDKSVIVHNRVSDDDIVAVIDKNWNDHFRRRLVLHCVTPSKVILKFVKKRNVFVGFDGDLTYDQRKIDFAKEIPLDQIVIETDSPYLVPEPLKTDHIYPNEPKNLLYIAKKLATAKDTDIEKVKEVTTKNAKELFAI